ncbi:hypothetical protein QTI66_01085 [Variovorax sp. J22R133]|uniref:hypothetical protein n=1 Tax=Variovorax brevis TaxID=3053503 RepID=UPI002576A93C|nr:hypothetical protein [Variovorax sp. J22R133]MDM0110719.1 hypothetical protein [Variovorax sp. J22R133]
MKLRRFFVGLTLASGLLAATTQIHAMDVEFAFRWDPSVGGPPSASAVKAQLAPNGKVDDEDHFKIRYATDAKSPANLTVTKTILRTRLRTNKLRHELTYKVRNDSPLPPAPSFEGSACPAGEATEEPKTEIDITFNAQDVARAYSRSCTVESKSKAPPVPEALNAHFAPCESSMTRLTIKRKNRPDLKIEEWTLPGNRRAIEVSQAGEDSPQAIGAFRKKVVSPLAKKGAIALPDTKTELGSQCGG